MSRRVHYILSSHWDREWYQAFQHYRYRLVQMLDRVLDGLAAGAIKGPFTTDGQAIMLEDYLEVHPERGEQVRRLVAQGKLVVGPWYVLPDEFLVSGESLIRNLERGRRTARQFGAEPSCAGFLCDLFGHNSQMPQILAGFGIRGGFVWRGTNARHTRLVRWRGADGSEMICYRFGLHGYSDFAAAARRAHARRDADGAPLVPTAEQFDQALFEHLRAEAEITPEPAPMLAFDGGDHHGWDEPFYAVLAARLGIERDGFQIVHSTLDAYLDELRAHEPAIETRLEGELREPGLCHEGDGLYLIPGVGSSRVWIKQANARCQALLCHWAEPMAAFAAVAAGQPWPGGFLDVAWRWLLQNHPHDSICGCSIDQVHRDMAYRFSQCRQIAEQLTIEATRAIAARVAGESADREQRLVVFNPLPQPLEQTVELTVQLPVDCPSYPSHAAVSRELRFHVADAAGRELPFQALAQRFNRRSLNPHPTLVPFERKTHEVDLSVPLTVPPLGYATLRVRPGDPGRADRPALGPSLAVSDRAIANEHIKAFVAADGSLTVVDRRTGRTYERLMTFEDAADCGDGWCRGPVVAEQVFTSAACRADVALVADGPHLATLRIRTPMRVPRAFAFDDSDRRRDEFVELMIDSRVSLRPGAARLEVVTTVDNRAADHRLRVLLPSGAAAARTYLADSPFDVVERPIPLRADNHLYREPEVETKPQQAWTAVFDADHGLAVVSTGLMESAVRDLPDRPIALTLFRATGRTFCTNGEPDGQSIGPMTFGYWIVPLTGEPDRAELCRLGQQLAAGVRTVQLRPHELAAPPDATLPTAAGLFRLEGNGVVTSVRRMGSALHVRLFNPTARDARCEIDFDQPASGFRPDRGRCVDFENRTIDETLTVTNGRCSVNLRPKQIVTIAFE